MDVRLCSHLLAEALLSFCRVLDADEGRAVEPGLGDKTFLWLDLRANLEKRKNGWAFGKSSVRILPLKLLRLLLSVGPWGISEINCERHWAESVIFLQNMGLFLLFALQFSLSCTLKEPTNITANGNVSALGSSNVILCNGKEQEICTSHNFTWQFPSSTSSPL